MSIWTRASAGILHSMATVVAFHAHPVDEVILTGGTLARAVTAGHRVVVVTATDPCAAISSSDSAKATVESASGAAPLVVS